MFLPVSIYAQEGADAGEPAGEDAAMEEPAEDAIEESTTETAADAEAGEPTVDTRLVPVFPDEPEGLIFVEGEDAVSTNFAKTPVYNYSCSGLKTLQLSRATGLQGGAPFYAEYVVYVEEAGTYSFGYGGTPPGPADDLYPSYVSPFSYSLDDGPENLTYREDVAVVSGYTPAYYWIHIGEVELSEGIHTVTFRVSQKRGFDSNYFFYIDNFFFMKNDRVDDIVKNPGRRVFPKDYSDRSMNNPFLSIADYMKVIQSRPEDPEPYIELSLVYSLIGDYLNALKMLNKAIALDPKNPYPLLLSAKNKIWKGDIADGIETYREVLDLNPDDPSLWAEAAKVAAWTNLYKDALELYRGALERFPDNISLTVNMALTYIWMSRNEDADTYLGKAREFAEEDPERFAELGQVFMQSGYENRAAEVYEAAVETFPAYLELYLLLETAYEKLGLMDKADAVYQRISETFQPSAELTSYLELFRKKSRLKQDIIDGYRRMIREDPVNLDLRSFLVQTYFWNGLRERAVEEMLNILAGHAYNTFTRLDERSMELYETVDRMLVYSRWFDRVATEGNRLQDALDEQVSVYRTAKKAADKEAASEEDIGTAARDLFRKEEDKLNELLEEVNAFAETYAANLDTVLRQSDLQAFVERENEEKKAFGLLTENINWTWDRRFHMEELQRIRNQEPVLAGYVLGRIHHIEGDYTTAAGLFKTPELSGSDLPPVRFARYQLDSWNPPDVQEEAPGPDPAALSEYAPYVSGIPDISEGLKEVRDAGYLHPDDPAVEAETFISKLDDIEDDVPTQRKNIDNKVETLRRILRGRMERSFYQLEENTYLLRYELGDYYLALEKAEAAVEQFRMVLAIDPWNISATYKLGTMQQKAGNWAKAMDSYRKVYWNDPDYQNTVRYYNQLARRYADSFSFSSVAMYDNARQDYDVSASFKRPVNSMLGWNLLYDFKNDRLYRPSGTEEPSAFSLHTLGFELPLSLYFIDLSITPYGGISLYNNLYDGTPTFSADSSYEPGMVLTEFDTDLVYGVKGRLGLGSVELSGGWDYRRKSDTYFPSRTAIYANAADVNVATYFSFPAIEAVNSFGTRTYGKLEILSDANLLGTVVQEVVGSFHLADSPWVNLDLTGTGSWENGVDSTVDNYYAPDNALAIRGGVRGSVSLPAGAGSLGMTVYLAAGGYRSASDPEGMSLQSEGSFNLGFYRGQSALTLSLYGSGTFTRGAFPLTDYWAFQGSLGFSTKMPDLLAE